MFTGRNIYRTVFKNRLPERNELFLPKRMAYVIDLEDEETDTDVPTTLIRSKADCPNVEVNFTAEQDTPFTQDWILQEAVQVKYVCVCVKP